MYPVGVLEDTTAHKVIAVPERTFCARSAVLWPKRIKPFWWLQSFNRFEIIHEWLFPPTWPQ